MGGRTGNFKFINVEEVEEVVVPPPTAVPDLRLAEVTVTGLLCRLELAHLTSRLVLNGWDSLGRLEQLGRRDLVYLGVQDRGEQDRLLAAVSGLQGADRRLARMDSGCYDLRDSESDDLGSDPLTRSNSFDSLPRLEDVSGESSPRSCDTNRRNQKPLESRKLDPECQQSSEPRTLKSSKIREKFDSSFSEKFAQTLQFFETGPVPDAGAGPLVRRRTAGSITESRLSIAEPTDHLNSSF